MLFKIIGCKIIIYFAMKRNLLNSAAIVKFVKMNSLQEKALSCFIETKPDIQIQ